jgi:hypothetical protein
VTLFLCSTASAAAAAALASPNEQPAVNNTDTQSVEMGADANLALAATCACSTVSKVQPAVKATDMHIAFPPIDKTNKLDRTTKPYGFYFLSTIQSRTILFQVHDTNDSTILVRLQRRFKIVALKKHLSSPILYQ